MLRARKTVLDVSRNWLGKPQRNLQGRQIWKGKSAQEARNLKLRFSTKVLAALGALRHGYAKDNRNANSRDVQDRLSSYKNAVKTLQLIYPPYPSSDQPSSETGADSLREESPDVEIANTLLMTAMPADEGGEFSEFRTFLPFFWKRSEN